MTGPLASCANAVDEEVARVPDRIFIAAEESSTERLFLRDLRAVGLDAFVLSDVAEVGADYVSALRSAIKSADALVLVLTKDTPRNQLVDAGLALAANVPIITVALDDTPLPRALKQGAVVRSRDPLLIVEAIRSARRKKTSSSAAPVERPIGSQAEHLVQRTVSGNEAESIAAIAAAIETSGAIVVKGRNPQQFDLAVWSDDLASVGANPLFLEWVKSVNPHTLENVASKLGATATPTLAVVVYSMDSSSRERAQRTAGPGYPVLFVSAARLINNLQTQSFAKTVRSLRNEWVHGVDVGRP